MIDTARLIAAVAHVGQTDKAGVDYLLHPYRVSLLVESDDAKIVAWLHDTVEDSTGKVTLEDLTEVGFAPHIVEAVDAISRREGEGDEYYVRVRGNPLALEVKYADIEDNTDEHRLSLLPVEEADRLRAKYAHALEILKDHG